MRSSRDGTPGLEGDPNRLKLLDITEFYSPSGGGVRTYLSAKANRLAGNSDIEHVIVLPSDRDAVERWNSSKIYHVKGAPVPANPGYHFLTAAGTLRSIFERERPDVVEIGSPFLAPWITRWAARGRSPKLVGYYHCDVRSVYVAFGLRNAPAAIRRIADAILTRYLKNVYGGFDHTIAATPTAAFALRTLGIHSVSTIPLGVDTDLFRPDRRDESWKAEVGANAADLVALYVGRLAAEKGLDVLLEALPRLAALAKLKLVVIGEGHMRERLERVSRDSPDRLVLLQYERDAERLARAYAGADLYIAPFPYETFGLAAAEALASGTPVVGADSGGLRDLLRDTGCGRLFKPGDAADLVRSVLDLLHEDLDCLGKRARELVEKRYSWNRTFGEMIALYRRLAGRQATA